MYEYLYRVARLLLACAQGSAEDRPAIAGTSCRELAAITRALVLHPDGRASAVQTYRRVIRHLAAARGGFVGTVWYLAQLAQPPRAAR
jgi:hypothetical protein